MSSGFHGLTSCSARSAITRSLLVPQSPAAPTMKALASFSRFRQALCNNSAAVGRAQFAGGQSSVSVRSMAVARAVRSPAKDKDTGEDITVEQKVKAACLAPFPLLNIALAGHQGLLEAQVISDA